MANTTPSATALRMRKYRARRRDAGLIERREWVEDPSNEVWSDHRVLDVRSLALHALIARDLIADPSLLTRAKDNLTRWASRYQDPPPYIAEWEHVLDQEPNEVACFLVSGSPKATRLRQSSPFAGMLSPGKRRALLDLFRATSR